MYRKHLNMPGIHNRQLIILVLLLTTTQWMDFIKIIGAIRVAITQQYCANTLGTATTTADFRLRTYWKERLPAWLPVRQLASQVATAIIINYLLSYCHTSTCFSAFIHIHHIQTTVVDTITDVRQEGTALTTRHMTSHAVFIG